MEEPLAEIEAEEILVKVDAGEEWLLVEPEVLVETLPLRVEEVVVWLIARVAFKAAENSVPRREFGAKPQPQITVSFWVGGFFFTSGSKY